MWDHSIQTDSRQNNALLLYHIPLELYNAEYSYPGTPLQIRHGGNLVDKNWINSDVISCFTWLKDDWMITEWRLKGDWKTGF